MKCMRKTSGSIINGNQLDFGAGKVLGGRNDVQTGNFGRLGAFRQCRLLKKEIVAGVFTCGTGNPEARRSIALGIEIDQQRFPPGCRHRRGDIDRGGRLADPALLVGYGDGDH